MKGTIVKCLEELVITQFGKDKWEAILEDADMSASTVIWPLSDIADAQVLKLVEATCENLGISLVEAADAFGDYWVNVYSQRMYPLYYARNQTAKDFLLDLDNVHVEMTHMMERARPPRFDHEWEDDRTLTIRYKSDRGLLDFAVGLVKAVGKHYGEDLKASRSEPDKVRIVFA
jgi:hypothetical protein